MNDEHTSLNLLRKSLDDVGEALDKLNAALQPWHEQIEKIERVAFSELSVKVRLNYAKLILYGR